MRAIGAAAKEFAGLRAADEQDRRLFCYRLGRNLSTKSSKQQHISLVTICINYIYLVYTIPRSNNK